MKDFQLKPFHEMNFFTVLILRTLMLPIAGCIEITAAVFITLKLAGIIAWPWLVVIIPLIVSLVTGTIFARKTSRREALIRPTVPTKSLSVKLMH